MKDIRALIVDDLGDIRGLLRAILKRMGVKEIHEATNGLEALRILERQNKTAKIMHLNININVVLCDINMPKMDGITFLREINKRKEFNDVVVIMVTGEGKKETIVEAVKFGADDCIVKPYTLKTLEEKITKAFTRKGGK